MDRRRCQVTGQPGGLAMRETGETQRPSTEPRRRSNGPLRRLRQPRLSARLRGRSTRGWRDGAYWAAWSSGGPTTEAPIPAPRAGGLPGGRVAGSPVETGPAATNARTTDRTNRQKRPPEKDEGRREGPDAL